MSENRYKSLGKNTIIFAAGTFGSKAISFLMLPIFTRVLTQSDYGIINIVTTTISLLMPILTLNIVEAVFRFTLEKTTVDEKQSVLTTSLIIGFIGFLILLLFFPVFSIIGLNRSLIILFYLMFFLTVIHGIIKVLVRAEKRLKLFAVSDIVDTFVFATFGILLVAYFKYGVNGYILARIIALGASTTLLIALSPVLKYIKFNSVRKTYIKKMILYSLPLVPNAVAWWIMNVSDRYLVAFFLGFSPTGIYSVAYKFPTLLTLINGIFYKAWQISSIEQYGSSEREEFYSTVFKYLYVFMFSISIILAISIKPIVYLMTGPDFREAWRYIPFLILGVVYFSFSQFFGVGYLATKKTIGAFRTSIIGAAVNIGVNLSLIPLIGIQAASISTFLAFFVMWIARLIETRRYFSIQINWLRFILDSSLAVIALMMNYLSIYGLFIQIACFVIFVIIERKAIKTIYIKTINYLKRKT